MHSSETCQLIHVFHGKYPEKLSVERLAKWLLEFSAGGITTVCRGRRISVVPFYDPSSEPEKEGKFSGYLSAFYGKIPDGTQAEANKFRC